MILASHQPDNADLLADALGAELGRKVTIAVPQRGEKRELADTVRKNAEQALALHRSRRSGDLTTRSRALQEIQEALDLQSAPLRIECYDISHTMGTEVVASMVVFEDGLARKSEYRRFEIRDGAVAEGRAARKRASVATSRAENESSNR